jgi:glycerol-3-phosphate dehydrogenase
MSGPLVIVVGGGGTGAALAWDLSLRGAQVTLVERAELTSGTTGRHHGQLHCGARYAVNDPRIGAECMRENVTLRRIASDSIEFNYGLFVALGEAEERYCDLFLSGCGACGIPTRLLSPREALDMEPSLNPRLRLAVLVPDGSMDAWRLVLQFAAAARAQGADLRTFTEVIELLVTPGRGPRARSRVRGARLRDRRARREYVVEADLVINAGGAWAARVAALAGAQVAVRPSPGTMVAVRGRLTNMVISRLHPPGDADIIVPQRNLSIVGSSEWLTDDPDDIQPRAGDLRMLQRLAAEMVPQYAEAPLHAVWCAARPLVGEPGASKLRSLSRDFVVTDHADRDGVEGLLSIVGGKATTLRAMAEAAADAACLQLGLTAPCRTAEIPLPPARSYYDAASRSAGVPAGPRGATTPQPIRDPSPPAPPATPAPRETHAPTSGNGAGPGSRRTVGFRLFRARPGVTPSFEEIRLVVGPETTVLDVLVRLHGRDPDLLHRHSCHHGSCGTCACRINGRERLACTTRVLELDNETVTLEPLRKFALEADLVTDPAVFFREFPRGLRTLTASEWMPQSRLPEELPARTRLENCIECGACVSACPVEDFLGPALLAAINRERNNRPDSEARMLELAAGERGVWSCQRALECSRVCPTAVYPARHIQELRTRLRTPR